MKRSSGATAAVAAFLFCSGCASTPPPAASQIVETDEAGVEGCQFLGTVTGKSGFGGITVGRARRGAMNSVKKRAADLGATHVVVGSFDASGGGLTSEMSTLGAKAYRCTTD